MLIVSLVLISGLLILTGCFGGNATGDETAKNPETNEKNDPTATEAPIKKVDFKNFAYPLKKEAADKEEKTLALKDGKLEKTKDSNGATIGQIQYADLTGDKKEEAIIDLSVEGEKQTDLVYVYTLENEKPQLLWSFEMPGGTDSGLKAVASENGNLLVEIFGDAKFVKGVWETAESKDKKTFTKTVLKWNGKEFAVEGQPETLELEKKAPAAS